MTAHCSLYQLAYRSVRTGGASSPDVLLRHYGARLFTVEGPVENIKITSASDFYIFRAIVEARENSQIWGQ